MKVGEAHFHWRRFPALQLIPAILGQLNYARSGASVPSDIAACIDQGNAMIGDRVINPVGNGLCDCCNTVPPSCNNAGSNSVCRDPPSGPKTIEYQGCTPFTETSYTPFGSIITCLSSWNVNGECPVTPA